ncbi:ABC transporter permease [Streptomyces sp. XM4193]|uniref:ABC transporter permease n=1 Tax=Streptomyces sp. XM4193 TaxID=2929782 RepID=UPI0027E30C19|nr:ABC transporter permease [Streptomyces sp. XM4193]
MGARRVDEDTRTAGRHRESGRRSGGLLGGAVTPRAALLMLGVLLLQLAFVASYIGAFHRPDPQRVPIDVVAPDRSRPELERRLDALDGRPLDVVRGTSDRESAERRLRQREVDGVWVVDPGGRTDTLLVAGAAGASTAQALEEVFERVQREENRELRTEDLVPARTGDSRGLSAFYLAIGWCVGGYLSAAVLAMSYGARPSTVRRAGVRLAAVVVYSLLAGLGGALIAGPLLDALPGGVLPMAGLGALTVFAVGAATLALQSLAGTVGIGLAILLVVVLGNPSAGGAYGGPLLPTFWREIGPLLPTGAATWSARSIAYFQNAALGGPLLVLGAWAAAGVVLTLLFTLRHRRRAREDELKPSWAR